MIDARRLVRLYVLCLGALLLLEGGGLLLADQLNLQLGLSASDSRHNLLHVAWGIPLLVVALTSGLSRRVTWAAVIFGVFYVSLGIAGLVSNQAFGLQLGLGENIFHFTVGPLALLLGLWALRSSSASNASRSAGASASSETTEPAR